MAAKDYKASVIPPLARWPKINSTAETPGPIIDSPISSSRVLLYNISDESPPSREPRRDSRTYFFHRPTGALREITLTTDLACVSVLLWRDIKGEARKIRSSSTYIYSPG